ncbi:MAG: sulfite exporter TauE/SafE family protein [Eubacteriales bacterium]
MDLITILLVGLVIFGASIMESVTGFGSGIIALPFLASLLGLKTAVPLIMVISIIFTTYMIITNHKKVAWKVYFTIIFFVSLGLPFGIFVFSAFNEDTLKLLLGIFVILSASRAMFMMRYLRQEKISKSYGVFQRIMLFFGGIVQGAFATGGPLIVIYSADKLKDKSIFRATMSTVWLTLNCILVTKNFIVGGIMTNKVFTLVMAAFPFFIAGTIIGLNLHKKVSIKAFSLMINIVLLLAGLSTIMWVVLN